MKRKKSILALALAVGYLSNTLLQPVLHGEEAVIPVQIEDHTLSPSTLSEDMASNSTLTSEVEDTLSRKKRDLGHPEDKPSPACPPTMTTVATYPAPTVSEEPSTPKKPCDSGDCVEVVPGTPSPTPEEETTKPTEPSKPSEPETEASTEATKETEPETTKASKETEAPKPPKPRNTDRVKPTEPTKETEPETVKPTEPVSPSEIERSIPKNSKPSTPIPPATPSKPKITMHKNGEVRGNHRDPVDEKYGEVYGSNRPFYVDENGEKVYYTDRTVHTGDERNMRRNMLLMLSAFGLLVLYGTMRFLKKLDVE